MLCYWNTRSTKLVINYVQLPGYILKLLEPQVNVACNRFYKNAKSGEVHRIYSRDPINWTVVEAHLDIGKPG